MVGSKNVDDTFKEHNNAIEKLYSNPSQNSQDIFAKHMVELEQKFDSNNGVQFWNRFLRDIYGTSQLGIPTNTFGI